MKKNLLITLGVIAIIIVVLSCTDSDQNENEIQNGFFTTEPTNAPLKDANYPPASNCIARLVDLNIHFWTLISNNPILDVEEICEDEDEDGLMNLTGLSSSEFTDLMDSLIYYSQCINPIVDSVDCNCTTIADYDNIYNFVLDIQNAGGPNSFFMQYNQDSMTGPDWGTIGDCLAACTLTCLPMTWSPPAWGACMAACTAICYSVSTN